MKKHLLRLITAAALLLGATDIGFAQCSGVFPASTVCGNPGGSSALPHAAPLSAFGGGSGTPGGSPNSIQYNNAGAFGGLGPTGGAIVNTNAVGVPSETLTPVIGIPGITLGTVGLAASAASATVTLRPASATGNYNWNYPVDAGSATGTARGPLLSGGGTTNPMIWATRSGTTTTFGTTSGTLVSGNCLQSDASFNIVDAGAACGGSSGGGPPAGVIKDFIAGSDFTPGVTTTLTLLSAPANANILTVMFDGVHQSHNTWGLSGAVITFLAAIPTNVLVVEAQYYTGGGSTTSPGGVTGNLQYNNGGVFGGANSSAYATSGSLFTFTAQTATDVPLTLKGAAVQSGDLLQWKNSANTTLASVDAAGVIRGSSGGVFSTLTDSALSIAGPVITNASGLLSSIAVLTAPNGGTGNATYTNGQLLIGNTGTGLLNAATLTAGSGVTIVNSAGGITISAAGGVSGPVSSSQGGSAPWANTSGTFLVNGKGACNIRAFGADEAASAAVNTAAIQNAINTCGMIYVPSPAGGQTFDARFKPSFCYKISSTLAWTSTKNGGAIGDGPSGSCLAQTSASICVIRPNGTSGAYFANMTLRHDVGVTPTAGGCGADFGATGSNSTLTAFNLQLYNNYDGVLLGATDLANFIGGIIQYHVNSGIVISSTTNNTQWNVTGGTVITNANNSALSIRCQGSGSTAPNMLDGIATAFIGGHAIDIDGTTCGVDNFRLTNSFLGETTLNAIRIRSHGTTPYVIDNVLIESPGYGCITGTFFNDCNGALIANAACQGTGGGIQVSSGFGGAVPITINKAIEYGCGAPAAAQFGVWIVNSPTWTITNSTFVTNAGAGIRVSDGVGYLSGNRTFDNGTFGIFSDSSTVALTTSGNYSGNNNSGVGSGSPNAVNTGVTLQSHTGDWCGTAPPTAPAIAACTWP